MAITRISVSYAGAEFPRIVRRASLSSDAVAFSLSRGAAPLHDGKRATSEDVGNPMVPLCGLVTHREQAYGSTVGDCRTRAKAVLTRFGGAPRTHTRAGAPWRCRVWVRRELLPCVRPHGARVPQQSHGAPAPGYSSRDCTPRRARSSSSWAARPLTPIAPSTAPLWGCRITTAPCAATRFGLPISLTLRPWLLSRSA